MRVASKRTVKFCFSSFIIYALFLHWTGWAGHSIFDSARALVDEGRLTIDSYADNNVDRLLINGHYYSNKPIGATLLATPSYALWKWIYTHTFPKSFRDRDLASTTKFPSQWYASVSIYDRLSLFERLGRVFVTLCSSTLLGLLTMWLVHRFAGRLGANEQDQLLLAVTFGFGTSVFYTATGLYQDAMGMLFCFWGFYLLFQANQTRRVVLVLWSGIVTGFSIAVSLWGILAVPAYLIYLAMGGHARKTPLFLLGSFIGVSPQLLYHYALTGNPWLAVFVHQDREIWTASMQTLGFKLQLENLIYIIPQVLLFPSRGLFFYSPILLLSWVGIVRMFKPYRAETITILIVFVLCVLGNASMRTWWGGDFGSRYSLSLIPFLTLPLVYVVRKNRRLFFVLLVYSILVNLSSTQLDAYARLPVTDRESDYAHMLEKAKGGVISNPVYEECLPRLWKNGPGSRLLESFTHDDDAFDLRLSRTSVMGFTPRDAIPWFTLHPVGFVSVKTRYLPVFLLVLVFSVLWARELSAWLQRKLERSR